MNAEEVRALTESRDTDAIVHRTLGLQCDFFVPMQGEFGSDLDGWYVTPFRYGELPEPLPCYSSDVKAAWFVVDHMLARGYDFECRSLLKGEIAFVFFDFKDFEMCIAGGVGHVHKVRDPFNSWEWPAKASTLPLAICRAALLALLSKQQEATDA